VDDPLDKPPHTASSDMLEPNQLTIPIERKDIQEQRLKILHLMIQDPSVGDLVDRADSSTFVYAASLNKEDKGNI
jgi:hypothetical protein